MSKSINSLERAARALCSLDGQSENAIVDGKPGWQNYLPAARTVFDAAQMAWRPISSARLDGTPLLLFLPDEPNPLRQQVVGYWDEANARWTALPAVMRLKPSLWLPLPPNP